MGVMVMGVMVMGVMVMGVMVVVGVMVVHHGLAGAHRRVRSGSALGGRFPAVSVVLAFATQ